MKKENDLFTREEIEKTDRELEELLAEMEKDKTPIFTDEEMEETDRELKKILEEAEKERPTLEELLAADLEDPTPDTLEADPPESRKHPTGRPGTHALSDPPQGAAATRKRRRPSHD